MPKLVKFSSSFPFSFFYCGSIHYFGAVSISKYIYTHTFPACFREFSFFIKISRKIAILRVGGFLRYVGDSDKRITMVDASR